MPRLPRILLSHSFYHIMTRGNNCHKVFDSTDDYKYYLDLVERYKEELPFDLYHYCLMPNHIHFLLQTRSAGDFSCFMKKLNLAYFHHYRKKYGWVGHLWQDRFKSQPVGKDNYLIQCGKYIELNPLRANLVDDSAGYPFSSYNFYAHGKTDNLLTRDIFYDELGDNDKKRQAVYRDLVISEVVSSSYEKKSWGSSTQRYQENKKIVNKFNKLSRDKKD